MKWWPESCQSGDMVRVRVGAIWHYGIFVSDDEVIEFGPPPVDAAFALNNEHRIMAVCIEDFAAGGIVERAILGRDERKKRIPPIKTIEIARSRIGEGGYDLIHNNCEHFAYSCVFGIERSTQEESVRDKWLNRPLLDVYIMKISDEREIAKVFPPERDKQIQDTTNERARTERFAVWFLLEKAIRRTFNLSMEDLNFSEHKGKWSCDRLNFSLSHSHGAVAVSVSNGPCGVDIENLDKFIARHKDPAFFKKIMHRICTNKEMSTLSSPKDLISLWTKKESIFKCYGSGGFFTRKIDTLAHRCDTRLVNLGDDYVLSVCGDKLEKVRFYVFEDNNFRQISSDDGRI